MPSIDCGLNNTAVGNDRKRAGRTGLAYLALSFFFMVMGFFAVRRLSRESGSTKNNSINAGSPERLSR